MNTNNLINVNIDTRQVVIPNNFTLGVENDNSCSKIGFLVPKKSDITDISDLTFKINTLSARGTADIIDCNTTEEDDYFIITAELKGTLFEVSGKAIINLCGCKYDADNNIIKKWGTEDIAVMVGAHTDSEKAIEQLYPSVLEELRKKIDASKVTEEQLNTIAQKVAEKGFYTKSEVDSLINAKPTITVDTELNKDSNNPIANSAVYNSFITVDSNVKAMFKNVNDNINGINDDLDTKANKTDLANYATKTDLDAKADKFTVDTTVTATSDNPVSSKAVSTSLNALSNEIGEGIEAELAEKADKTDLDKKVNTKWQKIGECSDITKGEIKLDLPCTEIIIVGSDLKASESSQVITYITDHANVSAHINGINGGVQSGTASTYIAELKVFEGYGIKATITSGTYPLSTCQPCYSTFVEADIGAIEKVKVTFMTWITPTSGKFTVYGR